MNGSLLRGVRVLAYVVFPLVTLGARQSSAQVNAGGLDPYRHTYDPEHGYVPLAGGYGFGGYGYGAGTAAAGVGTAAAGAGVAAAGIGQAAQGIGEGRLSTAQAQEAHQSATTQFLQNVGLAQETALQTSAKKAQATQQYDDATKAKIEAQVSLYNKTLEQMSAAHRLTAEQFDVGRGVLHWPFVLRGPQYADLRLKIDQLYDARTPQDSGTNSSGFDGIEQACQQMQGIVDGEVKTGLPVNDYVTARHFISSIAYEARFPVKAAN